MSINKGMMTSNSAEWETPQDFFDKLDAEFQFTLDVCATAENRKCALFYTLTDDALILSWAGNVCWMNPPYGRAIVNWVRKAYEEGQKPDTVVVCLVPSRTDTRWWHDYCMKGEIRFIKGRLKFSGHSNSAPFPSAVVIFGGA